MGVGLVGYSTLSSFGLIYVLWLTGEEVKHKSLSLVFGFLRERRGRSKYKVYLGKNETWILFMNFLLLITNSFTIKTGTKRNNLTLVVLPHLFGLGQGRESDFLWLPLMNV